MSSTGEYPIFKSIEEIPYTQTLRSKFNWAIENNKPEKIKEYIANLDNWLNSKFNK